MSSNITLSAGVRQNLLSLQNTASLMSTTQGRLATGKKVNTALDNPTNFFTSSSLQSRANDLSALLDSMANGIKMLEAADNGLTAITKAVESMQSTLRQARQDKSFKSNSYLLDTTAIGTSAAKTISFSGGSVGTTAVDIALNSVASAGTVTQAATTAAYVAPTGSNTLNFSINGTAITLDATSGADLTTAIGTINTALGSTNDFEAFDAGSGTLGIRAKQPGATALSITGTDANLFGAPTVGSESAAGEVKTVDELVSEINSNPNLTDKIRASNDNGKLRIENLSTSDLAVAGVAASSGKIDGGSESGSIDGNDVRKNLVKQFNDLRDQLNKLADDASFNGINLLRGDKLKITFNETGTSTIEIQAKDTTGNVRGIDTSDASLNIDELTNADMDSDANIDGLLDGLTTSLSVIRAQASSFGSNLSIVENRQDFTKAMITTLETGADNLVLADSNEEAANMLALQTRQQLASTALSLASQADQSVLRLFG